MTFAGTVPAGLASTPLGDADFGFESGPANGTGGWSRAESSSPHPVATTGRSDKSAKISGPREELAGRPFQRVEEPSKITGMHQW